MALGPEGEIHRPSTLCTRQDPSGASGKENITGPAACGSPSIQTAFSPLALHGRCNSATVLRAGENAVWIDESRRRRPGDVLLAGRAARVLAGAERGRPGGFTFRARAIARRPWILKVIFSRYLQPFGTFSGTVNGIAVDGLPASPRTTPPAGSRERLRRLFPRSALVLRTELVRYFFTSS